MSRFIERALELIEKLRKEPVRAHLYALGVAVLGVLQVAGYLDAGDVEQWAGVLAYVLVVENARRKVKPMRKVTNGDGYVDRSEEHTSELQSRGQLVCRLLLEKKKGEQVEVAAD